MIVLMAAGLYVNCCNSWHRDSLNFSTAVQKRLNQKKEGQMLPGCFAFVCMVNTGLHVKTCGPLISLSKQIQPSAGLPQPRISHIQTLR
ncbi:hypothetical protein WJX84_009742 [Apatococcus fuscideae]|uniref:Uncharacterized protein n=1 Tax=Apatococcus fuscideae TaxID=2026836 RepID=A0AAW1SSG3_9CHLO